jgi:hypothetical protein
MVSVSPPTSVQAKPVTTPTCGHDPDLILSLDLTEAMTAHAGIVRQILGRDLNGIGFLGQNLLHRLAGQVGDFPFQIAHASFTRIITDKIAQARIGDGPFAFLQAMRFYHLGHQVALCDLNLLILGIAGNADDFHAVHQRLRHVQAVGRGDEHHVRKIEINLQIMIVEGGILLRVEHF